MSSSHQSTIMSLEQAKKSYRNMVTKYLTYFTISQIVSGKGSMGLCVLKLSLKVPHWTIGTLIFDSSHIQN